MMNNNQYPEAARLQRVYVAAKAARLLCDWEGCSRATLKFDASDIAHHPQYRFSNAHKGCIKVR